MTHLKYQTICGWKGHLKNSFFEKETFRISLSFITALVIVFMVAKVLGLLDNALSNRYTNYNSIFSISIAQASELEGFKMIQSHKQINILKNKGFTFTIGFKNNGTKSWSKNGSSKVVIKSVGSQNPLKHVFWGAEDVAGKMSEVNKPGHIGYFAIPIQTPNKFGVFEQTFALYKGKTKISEDFKVVVNSWDSEEEVRMKRKITDTVSAKGGSASGGNKVNTVVNTLLTTNSNELVIRIGLFANDQPQTVYCACSYKVVDSNNNILASLNNESIVLDFLEDVNKYSYLVSGQLSVVMSFVRLVPSNSSDIFEIKSFENRPGWNQKLNDNKFYGNLELRYNAKNNRTWMINELPLETYLSGIAEVTNDAPVEYQKTMIIAARTYAVHHNKQATKHADEYFILDSVNDQVYKGQNMQNRQSKVVAAVEATRGQVVTYGGEIAITPYFSWSDGRTRSMKEVWNSDKPWLQSVVEPVGYDKTTLFGHGVGLSARGAYILAYDHGKTAEQILKYYYIGINLTNNYNR